MSGAPTVLLLPGNMCDARLWTGVRGAIGDHAVACPALVDDDTIDAMARCCLDAHPGALIPIGFSMGAIVALGIARLAPERVAAIALIAVNPAADLPDRAAVRPGQQAEVRAGGLERIVVDRLMPLYFADGHGEEAQRDLVVAMARDLGADVFVRQSEALRTRADQRDVARALAVPMLLAVGEADVLCPPDWHRAVHDAAPRSELHVIAGAGHMLPIEQPAALGRVLAGWLARVATMEPVA